MHPLPKARFLDPTTPPRLFTLVVVAATAALSLNIFLPSLPAITKHFDASYAVIQFLVSGYLLTTAIVQFFVGPISDRFGRRPVLLVGFAVFALASVVCALAPSAEILLTGRVLQASVVVGLVLSRAAIRDLVPGDRAASMIGYVTMGMALSPMLAPTIGGFLQELFDWRAAFWTMAFVGGLTFLLVWRDLGETNQNKSVNMTQQIRSYPELLTSRRFWAYAAAGALASACFFAMLGGAPFVGDQIYHLSPGKLGIYFMFTPLGYMIGNFISGSYTTRFGISRMMIAGASTTFGGMAISLVMILMGAGHPMAFFGLTVAIGLGNGMVLPGATAGMLNINPRLAGTAAGLGGALLTLGGAAISALVASILTVERGVYPLLFCILICSAGALVFTLYASRIEREVRAPEPA
ncbi:MAG: multidrug effflux MFS transporter [Rhodobacteraceae bacterium]|nr:multidrug effflux MFS transporter [Paracoccaceae bacterium]